MNFKYAKATEFTLKMIKYFPIKHLKGMRVHNSSTFVSVQDSAAA